ncbi:MAG: gamma-butyrobetaine hydroxylase-like domain-containing protein [Halofilum sp. (in: g-proteobacteria)]
MAAPKPTDITLHKQSRELEVAFEDGYQKRLPCEYLRVFSPSAEVQGHGPGQEVLVFGKEHVNIERIDPVGNYAVRLVFDDGHDTGIYTWETLYTLAAQFEENWQSYLARLEEAGVQRQA